MNQESKPVSEFLLDIITELKAIKEGLQWNIKTIADNSAEIERIKGQLTILSEQVSRLKKELSGHRAVGSLEHEI